MGKGMIVHLIEQELETNLTLDLAKDLLEQNFNASNTVIVTVSTDYSSNVGQLLRHALSFGGEICDGFGVDVPYPDEVWDERYIFELEQILNLYSYKLKGKKILLVEAGVIRGGNYSFLSNFLEGYLGITDNVFYLALFENKNSKFKSDFVGEYYDNSTQDLTFWWEEENKHWI
jgi:hypothetical protein